MVTLNVVPDDNPYSKLLLGKCIRRVDKLKSFGIEKVSIIILNHVFIYLSHL